MHRTMAYLHECPVFYPEDPLSQYFCKFVFHLFCLLSWSLGLFRVARRFFQRTLSVTVRHVLSQLDSEK